MGAQGAAPQQVCVAEVTPGSRIASMAKQSIVGGLCLVVWAGGSRVHSQAWGWPAKPAETGFIDAPSR